MRLNNQIALVTGGASGIGEACAQMLRKHGVRVMIWDKNIDDVTQDAIQCDVSRADDVEKAFKETVLKTGVPQICINCAGIAPAKRIVGKDGAMPLEDFKQVIDVNLIGTFNVMRIVAEAMMALPASNETNERGVFINTASVAAYEGQIGQAAYSASKGGIVSLTLPAAREFAQFGIRVMTIAPGLVATPLLLNMPEEVQKKLADSVPFPKRLGKPEEFAALAIHIIENSLLNGEVIRLDGAIRMQPR